LPSRTWAWPATGGAAAGVQAGQQRPLGGHGGLGGGVGQGPAQDAQALIVAAGLQGQRALTDGGEHDLRGEALGDPVCEAEAIQAGAGEHGGVDHPLGHLAQARVHVPAQHLQHQIRSGPPELADPAQAGRAHPCARRQSVQAGAGPAHQGVAGVGARRDGHQHQPIGQRRRHVLEAVHGQVHPALGQRPLDLLHPDGLAAVIDQRPDLLSIAFGDDDRELDHQAGVALAQGRRDVLRLPAGQRAAAGPDDHSLAHPTFFF
jgi:hypothetical protein